MKSRSQPNLFVDSARVEDLPNYFTVPLLLLPSLVRPWGFEVFLPQQAELILHSFCRFVPCICSVK